MLFFVINNINMHREFYAIYTYFTFLKKKINNAKDIYCAYNLKTNFCVTVLQLFCSKLFHEPPEVTYKAVKRQSHEKTV
jgi:hypothetical protein